MKIKENKLWVVLIYVLFLMSIWVAMWLVVFKNSFVYYNNLEYQDILENLHSNIYTKTDVAFKLVKTYNSNWWWFTDVMSCPWVWNAVTMSWDTLPITSWMTTTIKNIDWVVHCLSDSTHNSDYFRLYFNTAHDNFETAEFKDNYVTLTWSAPMQWETTFSWADLDNTLISFSLSWLPSDWYDDNFNSDDYKVVSTGSASTGTFYPEWFMDDDTFPRRMMFWYLNPDTKFRNIFWNNQAINDFIDANVNNNDSYFVKLWDVSSWSILITIDWTYDLKIAKYDRSQYTNDGTLYPVEVNNWNSLTWNWYIQKIWNTLSTSDTKTWNEYVFNFSVHDYALFLRNSWNADLSYNIMVETDTWSGVYMSPIDDSWVWLRYLWNDIYIDSEWKFSPDQFIVTWEK